MTDLLSLIIIVVVIVIAIIVIRFVIKITSFLTKFFLWVGLLLVGIYVINFYLLPKLSKNPFLSKEQVINKIFKNKRLKQDIKLRLKKIMQAKLKTINMLKDVFTKDLGKDTTEFVSR